MSEYCSYLQAGSVPATMDRLLIDVLSKGNTGVLGGAELRVSASATDLSVNVNPGRAVVPAGTFINGIPVEGAYLYANTAVKNIPLTTADPTKYRTDLIVARIYDNVLFGDTGNTAQAELLTGAVSASSPAPAPVPSYSRYHILAQVRVNPNVTVPTLIVDQRALANPRELTVWNEVNGGTTNDVTAANPTFQDWPSQAQWTLTRPTWATAARFDLGLYNVYGATAGPSYFDVRVSCDGQVNTMHPQFAFTADQVNVRMLPYRMEDRIIAVPANPTNLWKVQSTRYAGSGVLRFDSSAWARLKVIYQEGLT